MRTLFTALFSLLVAAGVAQIAATQAATPEDVHKKAALVAAEIGTIANQLSLRPNTAIDFSKVSGEYCFFLGWDRHHTHYAIDPTKTREDTVDFVKAEPLVQAGLNLESLPRFPGGLGKMAPGQWYYLPAGELEPHHGGKQLDFPLLLRATDLQ